MCDEETQKEVEEYLRCHPEMTRRDFTKLASGAGLAMLFPTVLPIAISSTHRWAPMPLYWYGPTFWHCDLLFAKWASVWRVLAMQY